MIKNKERSIGLGFTKTNGTSIGGKTLKPCTWSLFKTIEGLLEMKNMCWKTSIDEARGLLTIYLLVKIPV